MDAPTTAPSVPTSSSSDYHVLRWLVLATFVVILNETIIINAIPTLTKDFGIATSTAQWVSSAFLLTMAVVIPITGWFLQRVTTRHAFAAGMGIFSVGTTLAIVAPTFGVLIAARVVQASGTAVMMPLLMTTLMTIVPEHDRGRVMGNVTLAISVAPAFGPTVSGFVLQYLSWRWIFAFVLPIALLVSWLAMRELTNVGERTAAKVDWLSVALSALGFGTLVYGLSLIGGNQDPSVPAGVYCAVGAVGIILFVLRQLQLQKADKPLLDLRTLNFRLYSISLALMGAAFMAFLGLFILLPLYFQVVRDLSVLTTGLLLMPGGLAMGVLGPQVGKLFDRFGARVLVVPGAAVITLALIVFTQITSTTPIALIVLTHVMLAIGLAFVFTPVFTVGLGALPPHLYSHGSSLLGSLQQLGGAAGTALIVAVSAVDGGLNAAPEAIAEGMQTGFAVAAAISVVVLILAFFMPGPQTQEQGQPAFDTAG